MKTNLFEDERGNQFRSTHFQFLEDDGTDQYPTQVNLKVVGNSRENQHQTPHFQTVEDDCIDQFPTQIDLKVVDNFKEQDSWTLDEMSTWILPAISLSGQLTSQSITSSHKVLTKDAGSQIALLRNLIKNSGLYAVVSLALPLISLVLAPFLTHALSPSDYGILAILTTLIGLTSGITQLGLASAFFRAYNYDYVSPKGQQAVLATSTLLLCLVSASVAICVMIFSPYLAGLLFGRPALGNLVALSGGVVLLQNLTVPGFSWLRAEQRPLLYSVLSISNLLLTLFTTIFFINGLHWGVAGSIMATGCGYAWVVLCTVPIILLRAGFKIHGDVARSLLTFGAPLIINFVSYWILQLSDRYLLGLFSSLSETARYAVVYTLGSAMSAVVISPFTLAWPTAMFAIAKRKDAARIFALLFRWFGFFLLFIAFGLSLAATFILDWLFPVAYRSAAPVIPVVAESIAFYGLYFVLMVGANIKRKTWLTAVFTTIAAVVNVSCNLVLIPLFGAMGAAVSTLIAYIVLALVAYVVNQRLYPVPFEIGRFSIAVCVGVALYLGASFLGQNQETYTVWEINAGMFLLYGACLLLLGKFSTLNHKVNREKRGRA